MNQPIICFFLIHCVEYIYQIWCLLDFILWAHSTQFFPLVFKHSQVYSFHTYLFFLSTAQPFRSLQDASNTNHEASVYTDKQQEAQAKKQYEPITNRRWISECRNIISKRVCKCTPTSPDICIINQYRVVQLACAVRFSAASHAGR